MLWTLPVPHAAAQDVRYDTGLNAVSGDYASGETSTTLTWNHGIALDLGPATLRLSIPVVAANGTALLTPGGYVPGRGVGTDSTATDRGGRDSEDGTVVDGIRVGIGDPVMSFAARLAQTSRGSLGAGLAVKAPVAEAGDLGTGEWDFGVTLDAMHSAGGAWFVGAGAAWWKLGDPADLDLRDPFMGTLMLTRIGDHKAASIICSAATAAVDGIAAPVSMGALVSRDLWGGTAGASATVGLTDGAPDFTFGLTWGMPLR